MSADGFPAALSFVLRWEGGLVDDPDDPGGRTNCGVTQKVYEAWRGAAGLTARDVAQIDAQEVAAIYQSSYWLRARCDALRPRTDLVHFDTSCNMGVNRAVRMLQAAAGCDVDGVFGALTEGAIGKCEPHALSERYCGAREAYYRRLVTMRPKLAKYLRGWLNRLNALRREVASAGAGVRAPVDFGDTDHIRRIPDIGVDPEFDV